LEKARNALMNTLNPLIANKDEHVSLVFGEVAAWQN
jgi:hypothetical protein